MNYTYCHSSLKTPTKRSIVSSTSIKLRHKEDQQLNRDIRRVSKGSNSSSSSFRKRWRNFNSSFHKRKSCKCQKSSVFNLEDYEPKEVSSVIKYLRFRKVIYLGWQSKSNLSFSLSFNLYDIFQFKTIDTLNQ